MFCSFYKEHKRTQECFILLKGTQKNTRKLRSFEKKVCLTLTSTVPILPVLYQIYCTYTVPVLHVLYLFYLYCTCSSYTVPVRSGLPVLRCVAPFKWRGCGKLNKY